MAKNLLFLFFSFSLCLTAQSKSEPKTEVQGEVVDFDGNPIHNAVIYVDSVYSGKRTNRKGIFKIRLENDVQVLSVYSANHGMLSKGYSKSIRIDYKFPEKVHPLTEQELIDLGFVTKNLVKNLEYSRYENIFDLIAAKFTGVEVRESQIIIRGSRSLTAGVMSRPLYIVDDSYVEDISTILPIEVLNIEVLKAESAAIYGARGGNGVIIIETIK